MAEVDIRGVRKTYPNGFEAISGIDLTVADGEFLVLVGPSGCGKSTLLRMVAGLETISDGEIRIGDRRVNELEPAERDIAMVFQNYALYPHMTVYGNMAYGLRNKRTRADEIERRVREAAQILELSPLLDRKPRQLSGGQRQRVAMGRAIVREPSVFLFDEPLSNLDAKLRAQMRVEIKKLQRSLATTSIYVTHDQVEAMTMADRLVVMNSGVAEQVGTAMEVYARPASHFVASFIGAPAMNFLDGVVGEDGSHVRIGFNMTLAVSGEHGAAPGRTVTVGIRPEHLIVAPDGALAMDVDLAEPLGAETLIHGRVHDAETPITVRLAEDARLGPGETIRFECAPDRVHLFDPQSGRAIGI